MDKEGERGRAGERVEEGKKKNYPRGAVRKRGMTRGQKDRNAGMCIKNVICGNLWPICEGIFSFFFFK